MYKTEINRFIIPAPNHNIDLTCYTLAWRKNLDLVQKRPLRLELNLIKTSKWVLNINPCFFVHLLGWFHLTPTPIRDILVWWDLTMFSGMVHLHLHTTGQLSDLSRMRVSLLFCVLSVDTLKSAGVNIYNRLPYELPLTKVTLYKTSIKSLSSLCPEYRMILKVFQRPKNFSCPLTSCLMFLSFLHLPLPHPT